MGPAIRGESGRGEVRDDVDVDDIAMPVSYTHLTLPTNSLV